MRLRGGGGRGAGELKRPRDGGGHGQDKASAVLRAHVLSLQQERLQLERLRTQLSDAIQCYGVVQKVWLPGERVSGGWASGPGACPPPPPGSVVPGLAWCGPIP